MYPLGSLDLMKIRVRNKFIMFLFGWGLFPPYVEAEHNLWRQWWRHAREDTP